MRIVSCLVFAAGLQLGCNDASFNGKKTEQHPAGVAPDEVDSPDEGKDDLERPTETPDEIDQSTDPNAEADTFLAAHALVIDGGAGPRCNGSSILGVASVGEFKKREFLYPWTNALAKKDDCEIVLVLRIAVDDGEGFADEDKILYRGTIVLKQKSQSLADFKDEFAAKSCTSLLTLALLDEGAALLPNAPKSLTIAATLTGCDQ